ncbi:MAG: DUF3108 domain-containing protein [Gammaproteobacteria bacterium HGW-Gammaproteobacteria-14]|nr:MAG: DUF3108 domain-containing protein [Gammaproteobacteria bacterium HGW-Gammaproteobacteria-14]
MTKYFPPKVFVTPGNLTRLFTVVITALAIPTLQAASEPQPFLQEFQLSSSGIPIRINAERKLRQLDDNRWQMSVEAKNLLGRVREVTLFSWSECTPQTTHYSYLRQGLGQKKEATLTLDRSRQRANSKNSNGTTRRYPIDDHTTDKLSQTLALQCMLQRGDQTLSIDVADERGRETLRYHIHGEENLTTPAGLFRTVKISRIREKTHGRQTWLWFAPDYDFALVKLVQEEDNQRHEMVIRSL